jgi:hypothetical protein
MFSLRRALWGGLALLAAGAAVAAAEPLTPEPEEPPRDIPSAQQSSRPPVPLRRPKPAPPEPPALPPALERIAACESGGDPAAVGGGGLYRGKYQFTRETWRALGGSGDPAAAPEAEQDRRALTHYRRSGTAAWPGCAG